MLVDPVAENEVDDVFVFPEIEGSPDLVIKFDITLSEDTVFVLEL